MHLVVDCLHYRESLVPKSFSFYIGFEKASQLDQKL